jgi:hypothetical protein
MPSEAYCWSNQARAFVVRVATEGWSPSVADAFRARKALAASDKVTEVEDDDDVSVVPADLAWAFDPALSALLALPV